jgi:hypothetical protein
MPFAKVGVHLPPTRLLLALETHSCTFVHGGWHRVVGKGKWV